MDNGDGTWTYTPALNGDTAVSFSYTIADSMDLVAGTATLDITPVNDAPIIGGLSTGVVSEDIDPDGDGAIESASVLTISDPDVGESAFQPAHHRERTYGGLPIDAAGSWSYGADNTQVAIRQLDTGESVSDVLTVTTADGTTHE